MRPVHVHFYNDAGKFEETKHPRGQPENAGEFAKKAGAAAKPAAQKPVKRLSRAEEIKQQAERTEARAKHLTEEHEKDFGLHGERWNSVPEEQRASLEAYINGKQYGRINRAMRGEEQPNKGTQRHIDNIKALMNRPDAVVHNPVTVYRSMYISTDKLAEMKQQVLSGQKPVIQNNAFTSTSLLDDIFVGQGYLHDSMVRFTIPLRKGDRALLVAPLSGKNAHEAEVILPPINMRVTKIEAPRTERYGAEDQKVTIIHLEPNEDDSKHTSDWAFQDDAGEFEEAKHPRAKGGPHGGQFVKKGASESGRVVKGVPYHGTPYVPMKAIHQAATHPTASVEQKAANIKQVAAGYKPANVASYANKVLKVLEIAHNKPAGSLGKAVPKGGAEATTTPTPTPPMSKPTPPATPTAPSGISPTFGSPEDIKNQIGATKSALEAKKAENNTHFKTLLAAEKAGASPAILAKIKTDLENSAAGVKKWEKTLADLESKLPKTPIPATTPSTTTSEHTSVTAPKDSPRYKRAIQLYDAAHKPESWHEAIKQIPTLTKKVWEDAGPAVRTAARTYAGNGSSAINTALRSPEAAESASAKVKEHIELLDELFESDAAKMTADTVLLRGETIPAEVIAGLEKQLKAGVPTRYTKTGFVSSSAAHRPAFSGKETWLEMTCKKGTPAVGLAPVSPLSENEVLLRHGQAFEVYEIVHRPSPIGTGNSGCVLIRMHTIGH